MPFINGVYVPKDSQDPLENASQRELEHETAPIGAKAEALAKKGRRRLPFYNRLKITLTVLLILCIVAMFVGIGSANAGITLSALGAMVLISIIYYIFTLRA